MERSYLIALFLSLAMFLSVPSISQANIMQNSGFETSDGSGCAANWFNWFDSSNGVGQQRVTDVFRSGAASAHTRLTNTQGFTIGGWGQVLTGWTPGQTITSSIWAKVSMAGNAYAQLKFEITKPSGNQDVWGPSTVSNNWTKLEQSFVIPLDTTQIKMLGVHVAPSGTNNGDIWFDDAAVISSSFSKSSPSGEEAWRIDCGNTADYADPSGNLWMKDESYTNLYRWGFTNGTVISTTQNISGTNMIPVFQTYRFGGTNMSYKVEVPNGDYKVTLMFAETYWTQAGKRVFDVAIQGVTVLTNYDIYATKGFATADVYTFQTTVNNGILAVTFPTVSQDNALICGIEVKPVNVSDDAFLDFIQKKMFWYFWNEADPTTGLVKDKEKDWTADTENVASIAATGFALSTYTIAASRGWITDNDAYQRVMETLNTFYTFLPNVHGFWYHFVNMSTGARAYSSEVSTVDSAIFIMGALQAGEYFRNTHPDVTSKVDALYRRMEWTWFTNIGDPSTYEFIDMGWKPQNDGGSYTIPSGKPEVGYYCTSWWNSYCESIFVDLLALGSPTYYIANPAWIDMQRRWVDAFGYHFIQQPSLFTHQYHHLYFDVMNKHDTIADYFGNSRKATFANELTCFNDLFGRYETKIWGLTASDGPGGYTGYGGTPGGYNDGTVAPTAATTSSIFTSGDSLAAARYMYFQYKHNIWGKYGFCDSFNVEQNFESPFVIGIDNGPMIIAIENYRTGMVRSTFMNNSYMQNALTAAGFKSFSQAPLITESSYESAGMRGMYAFDGNMSTRWSSQFSDPQWIEADFGSAKTISGVTINWEYAYAKSYKIQVSIDDTNWTDVYSTTTGAGGQEVITFSPVTARYLRLYGTQRGTQYGYSIWEIQVNYTDAPVGAVASSAESSDYTADKAVDNNLSTRWSSQFSDPQWIYIDFGTAKTFSTVTLNWQTAYGKAYELQVSDDTVNWRDIYSTTSGAGGIETINVGTKTARYLKMYGTQRGTQWGYSLWEFGTH